MMELIRFAKTKSCALSKTALIALMVCICVVLIRSAQSGDTLCVPVAYGVPALSGPPAWWNNPVQHAQDTMRDDPRWRGATSIGHGTGTIEEGEFRALQSTVSGQTYIYLSWYAINPTWSPASAQFIVVGVCPTSGAGDTLSFRINPFSAVPPDPSDSNCVPAASFAAYSGMSGTVLGGSVTATYPWLNDTRVWTFNDPGQRKLWAVHMRIPVGGSGLHLGTGPIRMWYQIQTVLSGGGSGGPIKYLWPATGTFFSVGTHTPPTLPNWGVVYLGSSTSCHGISLQAGDIGTTNASANEISFTSPNTFFAKPLNGMAAQIASYALHARFRIANWGSQADWNDIPHPDSVWKEVPGGDDVKNGSAIAAGASGMLSFSWTLTPCDTCGFYPSSDICHGACPFTYQKRKHQCMLVEMSGPGLTFLNNSVYRNMDYVHASTFSRDAEISVKGLADKASLQPQRDVYIYIEKLNMPDTVKQAAAPKDSAAIRDSIARATKGREVTAVVPSYSSQSKQPMYLVHVYRDVGDKETIDGHVYQILKAQTSFGHIVVHEGSLVGWESTLSGAEKIGPNLYKIGVPKNGAVIVSTTINAMESFPKPWWMKWLWLIILIVLAVLVLIKKLSK